MKSAFLLRVVVASLPLATAALFPTAPAAALPVFDSANYAQNLLQAARTLQQIEQQVQSLQNEAQMLADMASNLERIDFPQLQRIKDAMQRVDQLMGEAKGIGFKIDRLDDRFRSLFPGAAGDTLRRDRRVAEARTRFDDAMEGIRHSMRVQAQVAANVSEDALLIGELVARSQDAAGSLQAQQAANQLLALATKQQLQLQSLMASEFRSSALDRARRAQAESDGRASTRTFLGSGRAYTPR